MNNKGSIMDLFLLIIIVFVVTLFFGIFYYAWGQVNTALINIDSPIGNGSQTVGDIAQVTSGKFYQGLAQLEYIALAIVFGMIFMIMISNFLTKAHPVFFIVYVFVTLLAFIASVYVSNAYETLLTGQVFSSVLQGYTGVTFFMLHLPKFIAVIGFLGAIFLFIGITRDSQVGGSVI